MLCKLQSGCSLLNDDPRAAIQRPDAAQLVETR